MKLSGVYCSGYLGSNIRTSTYNIIKYYYNSFCATFCGMLHGGSIYIVSLSHSIYGLCLYNVVDFIYMYICTLFYYYGSIYYNIIMCIFYLLFSVLHE